VKAFLHNFLAKLHSLDMGVDSPPSGLRWCVITLFIAATVAVGLFTDLFFYGFIVPILPFMLSDRVDLPGEKVQSYVSAMLATYAGTSVIFPLPAGVIADKVKTG
jgi:MFS family permease